MNALLDAIRFDADGLVTVVAQSATDGTVLMVAWANRDAVAETLRTGLACYWSRSRARLWRKGETSGQVQHVRDIRIDCDGDTLLLLVDQDGVACHTGRLSCFHRAWREDALTVIAPVMTPPETLYRTAPSSPGDDPADRAQSS